MRESRRSGRVQSLQRLACNFRVADDATMLELLRILRISHVASQLRVGFLRSCERRQKYRMARVEWLGFVGLTAQLSLLVFSLRRPHLQDCLHPCFAIVWYSRGWL